ncbi:MAG: ABC transporter substrate-binding protein, partial [Lachnospiraceae bacterium]|nr:ABC transporter substrate-binding protein [Lachnospiraceae bacterium]
DYEYLRTLWNELHGTGTYRESAKQYLEEQGYTFTDTYQNTFSSLPSTWDLLSTSSAFDAMPVVDTTCGLLEYNSEGIQEPALATSYEVSDDGLTYTFHIREGQIWVDSQGRKVADLVADDWVAGMNHMMDTQCGLENLISGLIEGATAYIYGESTDFDTVGVKATDDYTLVYTLEYPCSYFASMLSYAAFLPMSRSYYISQGGQFGMDVWNMSENYTYGTDKDHIAYCGAFLLTNVTDKNSMNYSQNESYWNAENVAIKQINQYYNDGSDATKSYTDFNNGLLTAVSLSGARLELAKNDGNFEKYGWIQPAGVSSGLVSFNLNRQAYSNFNDGDCASSQTEEQKELTHAAVNNQHFRLAMAYAFDRATYNAVSEGEDLKYVILRNTFVPGDFVILENDATVEVNGESVTFPAGTNYGEIVQAQLDADGYPITAWDSEAMTSDGFDGWFNVDNAKAEMEIAIAELASIGYEVTAENPIMIDKIAGTYSESASNLAVAYKTMIEGTFDGLVQINIIDASSDSVYNYSAVYCDTGAECNFDISFDAGVGPDYGDPCTYLDYFLPYHDGLETIYLGLW